MSVRAFIDTNIFIYLYSAKEPKKRNICIDELDKHERVASIQILNETANVFRKKFNWSAEKIQVHLDNIEKFCLINRVERTTIDSALKLSEKYKYSYYDCLMLASALESGCDIILSEDMSDGQMIESKLKIVNPFS